MAPPPSAVAPRPPARPRPRPDRPGGPARRPRSPRRRPDLLVELRGDTIAWANLNGNGGGGTVNTGDATVDGPDGPDDRPLPTGAIYWANWASHMGTTISYANLDGSRRRRPRHHRARRSPARTGSRSTRRTDPTGRLYWPNHDMMPAQLDRVGAARCRRRRQRRRRRHPRRGPTATLDEPRGMMIDPAQRPPLLGELRRRPRHDDLLGEPRRHRRRRPDRRHRRSPGHPSRPTSPGVPRAPRSIPPPGRSTGPTSANWTLLQYANVDPAPGSRPFDHRAGDDQGVHGVAIDPDTERIYWANSVPNGISWRASTVTAAAISMCRVRVTRSAAPTCRRS